MWGRAGRIAPQFPTEQPLLLPSTPSHPHAPAPLQCPGDQPVCDTAQGMCFSADGKTSSKWISKNPAQASSSAEDILASARGGMDAATAERMVKRGGASGPMKAQARLGDMQV